MEKYNYDQGFIGFALLFIIMGFAYIVGGGAVSRDTEQSQASALNAIGRQQQALQPHPDPDYDSSSTPELE